MSRILKNPPKGPQYLRPNSASRSTFRRGSRIPTGFTTTRPLRIPTNGRPSISRVPPKSTANSPGERQ